MNEHQHTHSVSGPSQKATNTMANEVDAFVAGDVDKDTDFGIYSTPRGPFDGAARDVDARLASHWAAHTGFSQRALAQ